METKRLTNFCCTTITKGQLVEIFLKNSSRGKKECTCIIPAVEAVKSTLQITLHEDDSKEIKRFVTIFWNQFQKKYNKYGRKVSSLFQYNESWAKSYFRLPSKYLLHASTGPISIHNNDKIRSKKRKSFENLTPRSKRLRLAEISKSQIAHSTTAVLLATSKTVKSRDEFALSELLKKAAASPNRPSKILKKLGEPDVTKYTHDEAVNLFLENRMTKTIYESLRKQNKLRGADLYPNYKEMNEARKKCRPDEDSILVDGSSAVVSLQSLANHTASRLLLLQADVINALLQASNSSVLELELICSWGLDGSSSQSVYKQNIQSDTDYSHLFATTFTPLRMICKNLRENVVWTNQLPQSFGSCRPLHLQYKKETSELTLQEIERVTSEIDALYPLEIFLQNSKCVRITFNLSPTCIDGKVLAALHKVSCQRCPICKCKPSDFNRIENIDSSIFQSHEASLKHGISFLHARIKFMEYLLKLSYRLDIKVWKVMSVGDKEKVKMRKQKIQHEFLNKLCLRIDFPTPGGNGSSNDGNTSRRFFENYHESASILEIDPELVFRFKIILTAINCQLPLDADKFGLYCIETYKLIIAAYPWYNITPTVHKVLVHSKDIILSSVLPLGMLSEEGAETRNKFYRFDRLHHSRKTSQTHSLTDIFNRALDTSDPFVASFSLNSRKTLGRKSPLPSEVITFLKAPDVIPFKPLSQQSNSSSDSSQSSCTEDISEDLQNWTEYLEDLVVLESEDATDS